MLKVDTSALLRLRSDLKEAQKRLKEAKKEGLQKLGDTMVERLHDRIVSDRILPSKLVPDGHPTLVKEEVYADCFVAAATDKVLDITAEGMNEHMSNEQLSELLEYGDKRQAARPHLRLEGAWAEENGAAVVGQVIGDKLFGGMCT